MRRLALPLAASVAALALCLGGVAAQSQPQTPQSPAPPPAATRAAPPINGLVFVPRAEDIIATGVAAPANQVDTARVPALTAPEAQESLRRFIGLPLSQGLLDALRSAVGNYFASINRPFVSVAIPKQDVTDGVIQVVVIEGRLGKLGVEGNRWFDKGQYLDAIQLKPGDPIDSAELQAGVDQINRNPYRHATAAASAGAQPGDTDITLQAQDRFPVDVSAGIDNTGNSSTGLYRAWTALDWGNALWRGDDFNYRFTVNPEDPRLLKQHSLAYTSHLPWWHDTLSLSGAIVDSNTRGSSLITTAGHNDYASLRYQHPLPSIQVAGIGALTQSLALGYDFKSTNNNILFGGISVFPSTTEVDQFLGIYSGSLPDAWGTTNVTGTLVVSPGGLTELNNTATFQTQQAGARADYIYGNIALERLTNLVYGTSSDAKAIYQRSNGILLASEQLAYGGPYANRGFVTSGATRDEGFQTMHELRAPAIAPK
ncbi:MAG TPA: ShlB/FhaC/HecB family hemolysin secretion/activation protein, partial [Stellaceae bacterium]|nr:ShlB/FhaC/HecB family hemolysin secretion/activation protein [Stellaceae bacterium]